MKPSRLCHAETARATPPSQPRSACTPRPAVSASGHLLSPATMTPSLTPILDSSESWCRSLSWSRSAVRAARTLLRALCTVRAGAGHQTLLPPLLLPPAPRRPPSYTHPSGPGPRNCAAGGHSLGEAAHGVLSGLETPGSERGWEQSHGDDQPVGEGRG